MTLSLFCLFIVLVSVLGGLLPLSTVLTHTRLQVYLSVSAGAMLGAVFFHMLPEAARLGGANSIRWAALGLFCLFFLERFFAFHHHEAPTDPAEPCPPHAHEHGTGRGHSAGLLSELAPGGGAARAKGTSLDWGAAALGMSVHSLVGGVALASVCAADQTFGSVASPAAWGVFFATLLHKPADSLTIVSLMLRAGAPKRRAHFVNFGFALMIPLGAALFTFGLGTIGPASAAGWVAFSAGTFLYIALSDLIPELQFHEHDRLKLSLSLALGLAVMALAACLEV